MTIRPAAAADVALIHALVLELADYERARDEVRASPQQLHEALFGAERAAECLIAELHDTPVGFALFYRTFSTWEGVPGIWLEDLFVPERHRRSGAGRALLSELARITVARGYARLEWSALDWNEPALRFYEALGARRLSEWIQHRITGDALARLAGGG